MFLPGAGRTVLRRGAVDTREALLRRAQLARAEGRLDDAVAVGREALLHYPQDWRLALAFKRDVRATGRYPDGEAAFRQAARHFPDAEWLEHYGALYAFHADDLQTLRDRGEASLLQRPADNALRRLVADVARQQRDYSAAAAHYDLLPGATQRLAAVRLYQRLAEPLAVTGQYGLAAINLDRNPERWTLLQRQLSTGPAPHRITGVLGSALPEAAVRRLGAAGTGRGTLGCSLSHAAAWEWMLAQGLPHCLVIEDDVQPTLDLPAGLDGLGIPADCDLCFVNDQMEPQLPAAELEAATGFWTLPLAEVMRGFPANENAAGANGYVLSAAGARKLLAWVQADGFGGDVDWRMIQYGLTPDALAAIDPGSEAAAALARLPAILRPDRLTAAVLHPALIRTVAITSDREDQNRAGDR